MDFFKHNFRTTKHTSKISNLDPGSAIPNEGVIVIRAKCTKAIFYLAVHLFTNQHHCL